MFCSFLRALRYQTLQLKTCDFSGPCLRQTVKTNVSVVKFYPVFFGLVQGMLFIWILISTALNFYQPNLLFFLICSAYELKGFNNRLTEKKKFTCMWTPFRPDTTPSSLVLCRWSGVSWRSLRVCSPALCRSTRLARTASLPDSSSARRSWTPETATCSTHLQYFISCHLQALIENTHKQQFMVLSAYYGSYCVIVLFKFMLQ